MNLKKRRRRQRGQIEDRIGIYHMCKYINYTEQLKLELSGSLESGQQSARPLDGYREAEMGGEKLKKQHKKICG